MSSAIKISDLIRREFVCLDLEASTRDEAIQQVAQLAKTHPHLGDFASFCKAIYEREANGSTSIGHGVAIPHARTEQVKDLLVVVGRLAKGVSFDPSGSDEVRLVFLVGTPKKMMTEYLRLVGTLARHLKNESVRQKLLGAVTPDELIQAFIENESVSA